MIKNVRTVEDGEFKGEILYGKIRFIQRLTVKGLF